MKTAKAFVDLLDGKSGAYRDVRIKFSGRFGCCREIFDLASGVEIAREAMDGGKAKSTLEKLIKITEASMSLTFLDKIKAYKLIEIENDKKVKSLSDIGLL